MLSPIQPVHHVNGLTRASLEQLTSIGSQTPTSYQKAMIQSLATVALALVAEIVTILDTLWAVTTFPILTLYDAGRLICQISFQDFHDDFMVRIARIVRNVAVIIEMPFCLLARPFGKNALHFYDKPFEEVLVVDFMRNAKQCGIFSAKETSSSRQILYIRTSAAFSFTYQTMPNGFASPMQKLLDLLVRTNALVQISQKQAAMFSDSRAFPSFSHEVVFASLYEEVESLVGASRGFDITDQSTKTIRPLEVPNLRLTPAELADRSGAVEMKLAQDAVNAVVAYFTILATPSPSLAEGEIPLVQSPEFTTLTGRLQAIKEALATAMTQIERRRIQSQVPRAPYAGPQAPEF